MRITEHIYMVGSGTYGLSDPQDCHVWLLASGSTGEGRLALIDAGAGDNTETILANIESEGFDLGRLDTILLTHAHRDHAGGCATIKAQLPDTRIVASDAEAALLEHGSAEDLGLNLLGFDDPDRNALLPPCTVDTVVADGDTVDLGGCSIRAIVVPGHNPGCVCYLVEVDSKRVLFSGDTVTHGGYISVGNWPGSSLVSYREHIGRLSGLGVDGLLSGHHVFTLSRGQSHIDKVVDAFHGLWPPPQMHTVLDA